MCSLPPMKGNMLQHSHSTCLRQSKSYLFLACLSSNMTDFSCDGRLAALTRAKDLVVVIGPHNAIGKAVKEVDGDKRLSTVKDRIQVGTQAILLINSPSSLQEHPDTILCCSIQKVYLDSMDSEIDIAIILYDALSVQPSLPWRWIW